MNLEQQVCNLELSKRLKELGIKQESLFYWADKSLVISIDIDLLTKEDKVRTSSSIYNSWPDDEPKEIYSAFTASELLELFPKELDNTYLTISFSNTATCVCYTDQKGIFLEHYIETENEESLEDILSKMLIYLIANKLLENK